MSDPANECIELGHVRGLLSQHSQARCHSLPRSPNHFFEQSLHTNRRALRTIESRVSTQARNNAFPRFMSFGRSQPIPAEQSYQASFGFAAT